MKKVLFGKGNLYKANLHTHTDISDGDYSPEEVKRRYKEKGYSVVAFTDHEVFVPHNELTDENFLAINGYEVAINESKSALDFQFIKTYHLNLYAERNDITVPPVFNEQNMWIQKSKAYVTEDMKKIAYPFNYSAECVNDIIARAKKAEFLLCYNHPAWSMQNYTDYKDVKGAWGIEIFNTAADSVNLTDTDVPFSDMLKLGEKPFPIAADDSHKAEHIGGGFCMIDSPALEYGNIISALKNGDFYASEAPLIKEIFIEDGVLTVKTSPCEKIVMITNRRYTVGRSGEGITKAEIPLKVFYDWNGKGEGEDYFRIVVTDKRGKKAYTRAFFKEDFDL